MIATDVSVIVGVTIDHGPFQPVLMFSCVCINFRGQQVKQRVSDSDSWNSFS